MVSGRNAGVDDDWGSQNGPLISPYMWREFIKEPFRRTCAAAIEEELLVSLHCCGNIEPLMDDIVECVVVQRNA